MRPKLKPKKWENSLMTAGTATEQKSTMQSKESEPVGAVLVCGGGIAGIQASLDLSAAGFYVYLVEESPTIGGNMARLDKTFPTGDCATCIISPKVVACMRDLNIEVMTMAQVTALSGTAGHFTATVTTRPRSVNIDKCTGCGDCIERCPVRNVAKEVGSPTATKQLDVKDKTVLDGLVTRHQGDPGALMPVLEAINRAYGYLPRAMVEHVAIRLDIPLANVLKVASFYDKMRFKPVGRHVIQVCNGTSCHSQHSATLLKHLEKKLGIKDGQTDKTGRFTLHTVRCLGLCALSPSMRIGDVSFGKVTIEDIPTILEQFK
jgi:NADH:ubiquinone oxidoreductase subunit E/NAD-dependent dihydropyrimidine dehydrogenase PreA subunit